jgi:hypothetical protein
MTAPDGRRTTVARIGILHHPTKSIKNIPLALAAVALRLGSPARAGDSKDEACLAISHRDPETRAR